MDKQLTALERVNVQRLGEGADALGRGGGHLEGVAEGGVDVEDGRLGRDLLWKTL
jgi:hypothetical protein